MNGKSVGSTGVRFWNQLLVKVTALTVVILTAFALAIAYFDVGFFSDVLDREALGVGKAIAGTLATSLAEMTETATNVTIRNVRRDASLAYVEVVNPNTGVVLHHSFAGTPPQQESEVLHENTRALTNVIEGHHILDVPMQSANGTVVHVGIDPKETNSRLHEAKVRITFITIGALVIGSILASMIGRRLTLLAAKVVEGDLTQVVQLEEEDEVGELAQAFAQMVQRMKQVVGALQESVQLLSEAGRELSSSTAEQSETITRQATALQETQVTAQEIKQTSLLAAQKAEMVIRLAEKADGVSSQGEAAIERSLGGLTDIRAQVDEIATKIATLSDRTQQIGSITATVKDLADQSNMLALNAAIEAVRSGEHGKGFAVVAREIRSLADQSIQATNRVREILDDIGSAIHSTVQVAERGSQKIEGGLLQVRTSGENLRELSGIVKDNSAAVRQIAAAVSQQNAGITQIFGAVTDQTRMMDETMRRLETTTQAAEVLQSLSQRVSDVLKGFKV